MGQCMGIMKKQFLLGFLLLSATILIHGLKRSVCITIPKSGTHLLHKCLAHFNYPELVVAYNFIKNDPPGIDVVTENYPGVPPFHHKGDCFPEFSGPLPAGFIDWFDSSTSNRLSVHFPYTKEFADKISSDAFANFLTIRDPRDQVVSYAFMVYKYREDMQAPFEQVLLDLIDGQTRRFIPWGVALNNAYPLAWELGVVDFYKRYLPFAAQKNVKVIRFENLVGEAGGGSKEKQLQEIQAIAQHLDISLSSTQIEEIAQKLFGGTFTFREGQIGSWKKYFTPEIKQVFKNSPGALDLLIELGYEKDYLW